ncbi:MAG: glucosamine-6-phosphate deaminase [Bacteroidetes bacterium]|nr:glucosamine-6-phosphate deaminase [Bacteroidota bacterium]
MQTQIYKTRAEMGAAAAERVSSRIGQLLKEQATVNMIFAAAPSQNEFLAALLQAPVEWSRIRGFHMDEYIGLRPDAEQGFGNFLRQRLFGKAPFLSVEYIDGNAADPGGECVRYSRLLQRYPVDIVCMGIGENGHIAFNDPPVADFTDPFLVKVVELDGPCRRQQVNDGCFPSLHEVPTHAITLTVPALMAGRYVYCMVPGKLKAEAVYNTVRQEIAEAYPSTILRQHAEAELFLDADSAIKLKG